MMTTTTMTTTTTGTMTTDRDDRAAAPLRTRWTKAGGRKAGPHGRAFSVRTRLTAFVSLLLLTALASVGGLLWALESARVEREANAQIDQELAEFRALQRLGRDPETTEPLTVNRLIELFLSRNVPDDDEMIVGVLDGAEPLATANRQGTAILSEAGFQESFRSVQERGGTTEYDSPEFGRTWVTVVPVSRAQTGEEGQLALVTFMRDEYSELRSTMQTYVVMSALALIAITGLAWSQAGRLLSPLRALRETAEEMSTSDLTRRIPETGNDDITALTRTINTMFDRLQTGFEGQRRFLDDAGHELRTPLTVVSGHLELMDASDRAEVEQTRDLVIDEVDRMSRLVTELILLAKSARPDFLHTEALDLDSLLDSVHAKAVVLGERDWVREPSRGSGGLYADPQRLTQAMLQLVDNAVKHTDPGDRISLGAEHHGHRVELWVADTGPGVPEEDRSRIFERFERSVVRPGDEGFGLGLSIVGAIVAAHGGELSYAAEQPHGARFVLSLPITPPQEDPWHTS